MQKPAMGMDKNGCRGMVCLRSSTDLELDFLAASRNYWFVK